MKKSERVTKKKKPFSIEFSRELKAKQPPQKIKSLRNGVERQELLCGEVGMSGKELL